MMLRSGDVGRHPVSNVVSGFRRSARTGLRKADADAENHAELSQPSRPSCGLLGKLSLFSSNMQSVRPPHNGGGSCRVSVDGHRKDGLQESNRIAEAAGCFRCFRRTSRDRWAFNPYRKIVARGQEIGDRSASWIRQIAGADQFCWALMQPHRGPARAAEAAPRFSTWSPPRSNRWASQTAKGDRRDIVAHFRHAGGASRSRFCSHQREIGGTIRPDSNHRIVISGAQWSNKARQPRESRAAFSETSPQGTRKALPITLQVNRGATEGNRGRLPRR